MEDYNKIIESLNVKFLKAKNFKLLNPFSISNFYDIENTLLLLHDGDITLKLGDEELKARPGDILFVPAGKQTHIIYGQGEGNLLNNEKFITNREKYFQANQDPKLVGNIKNSFSYITFNAKLFDSVNFFTSLNIPAFVIRQNPTVSHLIIEVVLESLANSYGKERIQKIKTELIVIEVMRYVLENSLFVEQLATNSTYFKDPRLLEIFSYIKKYLGGDLSNKMLASVANVSEDYVGQYFKFLTGINPQDYIEYQRMEKAVDLLKTTKKSVREIGKEVGYKDTAYFCRRFKMMFGLPAGKMRKREAIAEG
ncbi:MAG: AraC family transcriptional regulator [Raineya sp.]|jgi:YesN/AraC family two-component response regulator|nr:AraC family transcriptional regulator [Raineya sp.]